MAIKIYADGDFPQEYPDGDFSAISVGFNLKLRGETIIMEGDERRVICNDKNGDRVYVESDDHEEVKDCMRGFGYTVG